MSAVGGNIPVTTGKTVLLVDDCETNRFLLQAYLEDQGYTVIHASSGCDALGTWKIQGGGVSLVVLDVRLPDMDGEAVLRQMLAVRPEARIIILTALANPEEGRDLSGAHSVITKTGDIEFLLHAIVAAII